MPTLFELHFCWDATTFLQNPIAGHGQGTDWKNRQTSSDGLVLGPPETHPVELAETVARVQMSQELAISSVLGFFGATKL